MSRALITAGTADFSLDSERLFGNSDTLHLMLLGMTMKADDGNAWERLGLVLRRVLGGAPAQSNLRKGAPPLRGVATDRRDAAEDHLGEEGQPLRHEADAPQNPSSLKGGSAGENETRGPRRDTAGRFRIARTRDRPAVHDVAPNCARTRA